MRPILEIGDGLFYGKIRLYQDRLEFDLRTRHVMVPIDQIGGISTEGFGARKLKVHTKTGDLIEAELTSKADYDMLVEGLRRVRSGETLGEDQIVEERYEPVVKATQEFTQDENVKMLGAVMVAVLAVVFVIALIWSALQWVWSAITSLF
jgi:hypothetical protein